ncbi:hypothetical protein GCM10018962_38780 [Dactylosporangium matsuzakiense]|uniref:Uncharacterized protein n=1 Tax=Dactylosporangium matsuzakiense TaxID=53360 RepID=A0A9W6KTL7_9ACTN|nr:hypothetical protein GCM10017581_079180 [Dactylosporangium matsuzakiense]
MDPGQRGDAVAARHLVLRAGALEDADDRAGAGAQGGPHGQERYGTRLVAGEQVERRRVDHSDLAARGLDGDAVARCGAAGPVAARAAAVVHGDAQRQAGLGGGVAPDRVHPAGLCGCGGHQHDEVRARVQPEAGDVRAHEVDLAHGRRDVVHGLDPGGQLGPGRPARVRHGREPIGGTPAPPVGYGWRYGRGRGIVVL